MRLTLSQLAEDTMIHLLPRPTFETIERDEFVYVAGVETGWAQRIRLRDVEAGVAWVRAESRRRGHRDVEWWVGWSATPHDLGDRLLELGLVQDDVPVLTGMTCTAPPPGAADVDVRRITTLEDYLATLEVDWEVWQLDGEERARRRAADIARWDEMEASGVVHHYAATLDGRRVGFARGIHTQGAVALFGAAVLPDARRRGVYRALVRARWDHAAERGTPVLVVQAGSMSAPVLDGLGFQRHGDLRLYVDRL